MTFEELELCIAIKQAGRCSDTPKTDKGRKQLARRVIEAWIDRTNDSYFPFTIDEVVQWDTRLRKNVDTRIKVDIALAHGNRCFWEHRGKGECSDEVEAGHVVARVTGAGDITVVNGMIECRFHNNARRSRTIEQYLTAGVVTSTERPA